MKVAFYLILWPMLLCSIGHSQNLPLNELGTAFQRTNLEVRWKAPADSLPKTLWTYRVVPADFAPKILSNLLVLGPFTERDKTNKFLHSSSDKNRERFALSNGRSLEISPNIGCVEYQDTAAEQMGVCEGVPEESQMLELTTSYLSKLGISNSELAKKPNGSDLLTYFTLRSAVLYDKSNQPYATNVYSRGVYFIRRLDGVDFLGIGARGGCRIDFGNHGKVSKISLLWRKVERERSFRTAAPSTIIKWVREGKAVLAPIRDDYDPIDWPTVKSVTITNATAYYFGEKGGVLQHEVFPFVTLSGTADTGKVDVPVEIDCPIIEDDAAKSAKRQ